MSIESNYYEMALLSEAAYVDLKGIDLTSDNVEDDLKDALTAKETGGVITEEQAEYFETNWEVVHYQGNTDTAITGQVSSSEISVNNTSFTPYELDLIWGTFYHSETLYFSSYVLEL